MDNNSPIVEISDGKLKGTEWEIENGEKVLAFLGIPYAQPPIKGLRFKAPLPAEPWEGIRDATKDGDACFSRDFSNKQIVGSEDCLYLNVFSKSLNPDQLRPVMVFIHGGGFVCGSSTSAMINPDFLLTEDVILVAMNYRLGILGFLNLDDPKLEVPGNAGMKDQTMALQWVQKNIEHFGGDPNNVTIFGISAGGASVHYHLLSPASKGLFHKAILQSGAVLNPWCYGTARLVDVLKVSGIDVEDESSALEYIQELPVDELYAIQEEYMKVKKAQLRLFGPVVEYPNSTAFITEEPAEIVKSDKWNKVPLIFGYCSMEGLFFMSDAYRDMFGMTGGAPELEEQVSIFLGLNRETALFKALMKLYEDSYITSGMENGTVMLFSDILFTAGIILSSKEHSAKSTAPVYLYRFSLQGGLNILSALVKDKNIDGACHGDDMGYLFRMQIIPGEPQPKPKKGSIEELTVNRMVKMWTNFAKESNPTPVGNDLDITWEPVNTDKINFLNVNKELSVETDPEEGRMSIWLKQQHLYDEFNVKISGNQMP